MPFSHSISTLVIHNSEGQLALALSSPHTLFFEQGFVCGLNSNLLVHLNFFTALNSGLLTSPLTLLQCPLHPNHVAEIRTPDEFRQRMETMCGRQCTRTLPCGHRCPAPCHNHNDANVCGCVELVGKCLSICRPVCLWVRVVLLVNIEAIPAMHCVECL